jgi:putative FmdB family regulatory protein
LLSNSQSDINHIRSRPYEIKYRRKDLDSLEERIMPIYEYRCRKCGELFEAFRAISDDDTQVECPKCGSKNPHREVSAFTSRGSSGKSGKLTFPT